MLVFKAEESGFKIGVLADLVVVVQGNKISIDKDRSFVRLTIWMNPDIGFRMLVTIFKLDRFVRYQSNFIASVCGRIFSRNRITE